MTKDRLHIVATSSEKGETYAGGKSRRQEAQAHFDRLWLVDPESMNPLRNCMERERLARTMSLISFSEDLGHVTDLGCGSGVLTRMVRDKAAQVDAVDVSPNALKKLQESDTAKITPLQDYVPMTKLKDDAYDLVICTELIADLQANEYRLLFSELARLVKANGSVVCSTSIDIFSEDALQRFHDLAESELQIDHWTFSYHRLYIRLKDFFEAPSRFYKGSRDQEYRLRQIKQRRSIGQQWYRFNSSKVMGWLWWPLTYLSYPFVYVLRQNRTLMLLLEKMTQFIWHESGITQAIFIGKRRPLFIELPANEIPRETKHKKQVWE